MMNTVNTLRVGCDEQELVNGANITENLEERIAILLPRVGDKFVGNIGRRDLARAAAHPYCIRPEIGRGAPRPTHNGVGHPLSFAFYPSSV